MGGLEPYSLIWSPMSDIALEPAQSETDQTVLILAHDGPLAVSVASDGVNYLCSGCSRLVLQDVHPRQFLSILIRCVRCGGISATPRRDGGEPIPAYSVVAPAGQYLLGSQLNVPGPGMFAARAAAEDYAFEVGAPYSERARQHAAMFPSGMSPETLRQISAMGRSILGVHFDRFDAMYERSKRHSTQAPDHHRLVDLIRYGDKAANQIESAGRGGQVTIDGDRIAELYTAISMFHRWRNHPAWDDLVASLADPSHVQHTVMLMCLASYLADVGNGVGIVHSEQASGRIPDAWVAVDSRGRIDIEIKTPHAFREPGSALSFERAVEIIERHVMRAGSISGGQIGEGRPGIIGFGAYHLGPGGVDLIEKAANEVLRRRGGRRSHIAGDRGRRGYVSDLPDARSVGQAHRDRHAAGSTQSDRNELRLLTRYSDIDGDTPVADDADDAATAVGHPSGCCGLSRLSEGRPQRSMPVRKRSEVQALSRRQLTAVSKGPPARGTVDR